MSALIPPPRPFLKWAGGKSRLLSQYQLYLPRQFRTYHEPFLGGGALFFYLQPAQAVLSDINPDLTNVYTCIRDRVESVIEHLKHHAACHGLTYYYQVRAHVPAESAQQAARLIYLNKTCFNGLYRVNGQGQFNVPMGRYKNPKICDPDLLRSVSVALRNTTIGQQHFAQILEQATSPDDFVYFDPPYHPLSTTSSFTGYSRYSFTADDQIQLRDVFVELATRGVKVMQSNSDCEFIRDLYRGFPIHTIEAARAINSNPGKRGKITETLIMSWS